MGSLGEHKQDAYERAIDSLARYKFMMFGYWAAIWTHLNQIDDNKESNPFAPFVRKSRELQSQQANWLDTSAKQGGEP